ncbi:MAG: polyribonucleotide nucleotidyltransferase, partial [Chloroflexota bacterium]
MEQTPKRFETTFEGKTFVFETGHLAGQAGGAVTVRVGDSMVFAAATMSSEARPGVDFMPLTVDYEERMYAGGRIPGSFFRREGRPSEDAILTARLTDRPLRPLFPKDLRNDVQVIIYAWSADGENPLDILAVNAASAALTISDAPFGGPVAAVRIGRVDGRFVVNPTFQQLDESELDLRIAGTRDAILMVECGAKQVGEAIMVQALEFGHQALQPLIALQERMAAELAKPKRAYVSAAANEELAQRVYQRVAGELDAILERPYVKAERSASFDALKAAALAEIAGEDETLVGPVKEAFESAMKKVVRARILDKGIRP